jgi:sugar/nucleoside kinase (ribokinase family)
LGKIDWKEKKMKKVAVFGSAVVDVILKSSEFKVVKNREVKGGVALCEVYGGKVEAQESFVLTGGAGTNVAVGLSRMGFVSSCVARIGEDLLAGVIVDKLREEGVDVSMVQKEIGGKTAVSAVLVSSDGGRSIVTHRGVSSNISSREVNWEKVKTADWIQVSSLGGNMSLLEDVVSFALKNKIQIGLNPGHGEIEHKEKLRKIIEKVNFLSVNLLEAREILSMHEGLEEELVSSFLKLGIERVVITNGNKGAVIGENGSLVRADGLKVKSIDDTGAGDGFAVGVVAGILKNRSGEESLKMGLCNGASVVMGMGAKEGLLREKEMFKWLKRKVKVEISQM